MPTSTIEGAVTTRHEHRYELLEATADSTWFRCVVANCGQLIQEHEDAGTGA